MFNLGFGEILVICVILIVVVGPERLPGLMKNVGKGMRTVRQASRDIRATVGLDELMREDVLVPPPRPTPKATVSRALPAPPPLAGEAPVPVPPDGASTPVSGDGAAAATAAPAEDKPGAS